jgi:hypothetical protein
MIALTLVVRVRCWRETELFGLFHADDWWMVCAAPLGAAIGVRIVKDNRPPPFIGKGIGGL